MRSAVAKDVMGRSATLTTRASGGGGAGLVVLEEEEEEEEVVELPAPRPRGKKRAASVTRAAQTNKCNLCDDLHVAG